MDLHFRADSPTVEQFDKPITGFVVLRDGSIAIVRDGLAMVQRLDRASQHALAVLLLRRLDAEAAGAGDAATAFAAAQGPAGHA